MKGKDKCKILKEIRAQIAAANDIAWVTEECPHKGDCRGTCPKCEAEVRQLERALSRRRALGKTIAVVGLSAGLITTTAACDALSAVGGNQLDGDMEAPVSTTSMELQGGITLPPETLGEVVEVGGDMVPVYYPTDFTLYETARLFYSKDSVILFEVIEENEKGQEIDNLPADEEFTVIGHNGSESEEAYLFLVQYKGKLYAVDKYYLDNYATEHIAVDD